jgi:hypothetical protein
VLGSVRAWQEGGVAQYQFGVWVFHVTESKEKLVVLTKELSTNV